MYEPSAKSIVGANIMVHLMFIIRRRHMSKGYMHTIALFMLLLLKDCEENIKIIDHILPLRKFKKLLVSNHTKLHEECNTIY